MTERPSAPVELNAYRSAVQRALATVSSAVAVDTCRQPREFTTYRMTIGGAEAVRVRTSASGHIRLAFDEFFVLDSVVGRHNARITGYRYSLLTDDQREIVAYHWHPGGAAPEFPHLHVLAGAGTLRPDVRAAHFPTGEVALADFFLLVIRDFRVRPLRPDYEELLGASREA